jgi:hypothetical protein
LVRSYLVLGLTFCLFACGSPAQSASAPAQQNQQASQKPPPAPAPVTKSQTTPRPQPKRILGLMPNYRAVSAGVLPPPPTSKEAFKVASEDTFDYSGFVFVGITSLMAEADNTHPTFGKGVDGFGDYYWHGFLDKAGGNYMVVWALPVVLHEDERYYAKGRGSVMSRAVYAATRIVVTPNYRGKNTFNGAEIFGRGISQAVSLAYYPSSTATLSGFTSKYAYALGRDALTNVFRELWPDLSYHVFHIHHSGPA